TGELVPHPGSFTAQRTFSVLLQRRASFPPSATPSAFGPLQRGQSVFGVASERGPRPPPCPPAKAASPRTSTATARVARLTRTRPISAPPFRPVRTEDPFVSSGAARSSLPWGRGVAVQHLLGPRRDHGPGLVGRHEFERVHAGRQVEHLPTAGPEREA